MIDLKSDGRYDLVGLFRIVVLFGQIKRVQSPVVVEGAVLVGGLLVGRLQSNHNGGVFRQRQELVERGGMGSVVYISVLRNGYQVLADVIDERLGQHGLAGGEVVQLYS